jgi:hypothetical protein
VQLFAGVNVPEVLDEENTTIPVGEYPPLTVARHDVEDPTRTEDGTQMRSVLVGALTTTIEVVPRLLSLLESPS